MTDHTPEQVNALLLQELDLQRKLLQSILAELQRVNENLVNK
jgi:hypothetical protein